MAIYGINVSENETVDAAKIKTGPRRLDIFIFRACSGMHDDGKYSENRIIAVNNFNYRGTYLWIDPYLASADPWVQGRNYWLRITAAGHEFNLPPIFDIEPATGTSLPPASVFVPKIVDAVTLMRNDYAGRYPILYSNISTFHDYLKVQTDPVLSKCPLWIAWPSKTPPVIAGYPGNWAMWQDQLDIPYPGITGNLDGTTIWPGTLSQLSSWVVSETAGIPKYDGVVDPAPPPPVIPPEGTQLDRIEAKLDALLKAQDTTIDKIDQVGKVFTGYAAG